MNWMRIFLGVSLILLCWTATLSYGQKRMPNFQFLDTDGNVHSQKDLSSGKALLLIYFRSDCDHCMHTAQMLKATASSYPTTIWMVSAESMDALRLFEDMTGFYDMPKIKVLQDHMGLMHQWFNFSQLPFIVLFDKNKKELKTFSELPSAASVKKALTK